jgi:hypothetical protein
MLIVGLPVGGTLFIAGGAVLACGAVAAGTVLLPAAGVRALARAYRRRAEAKRLERLRATARVRGNPLSGVGITFVAASKEFEE